MLLAAIMLLAPASSSAEEAYELRAYGTRCVSGQTDERRYTYVICHDALKENYLRVLDPNGVQVSYTRMPGANDVAPAPDGSYVYVSGGGTYPLRKFLREGTTYVQDYAYAPTTFTHWGATYRPDGRQIATDGYGNLYVANGMWMTPAPHVVTKFAPDGRLLAKFGDFSNTWNTGTFFSLAGIAVSRDGRHIYTTEVHNSRVQRFDRQADGSYRYATKWGNDAATDPYRVGLCMPTMLAAPYDVAVDAWGDVWTTSTSCTHLQKFSKDGIWKFASFAGNRGTTLPGLLANGEQQRSHNLAIDANGNVISGETSMWLVRQGPVPAWPLLEAGVDPAPQPDPEPEPEPAPDPVPAVDAADPALTGVTVPATTLSQVIAVTIAATDDVGVHQVRFANDYGVWEAWQPFSATMQFSLRVGIGTRGVYTQVRDAVGRESNVVYRTTLVTAQEPAPEPAPDPAPEPDPEPQPEPAPGPDVTAPTLRQVTIPATTVTSAIDVVIDGVDDHGITQMRLATDDGNWGAWQAHAPTVRFNLRAGIGYRGVYVQLRDAAGNESGSLYRMTHVL